ncbi:MAG: hypothetical protein U1D55_04510 [Phycisphaerae bacterium]
MNKAATSVRQSRASWRATARRQSLVSAFASLLIANPARAGDEDIWAIRCATFQGNGRSEQAAVYEKALKQASGLNARLVTVIDENGASVLCYGRYAHHFEAATARETFKPDPRKDLEKIRELSLETDGKVAWPFRLATLIPLPESDAGPPEWQIANARGHWSLQVGVFYNEGEMRQRKQAAVEYCKLLRQQGQEAYFHHGPVNSSVCIGAFPKEAIQTVRREEPLTGRIQFTQKIVDPKMLELQKKYPNNTQNGHIISTVTYDSKGQKQRSPEPSFPVEIPRGGDVTPEKPGRR